MQIEKIPVFTLRSRLDCSFTSRVDTAHHGTLRVANFMPHYILMNLLLNIFPFRLRYCNGLFRNLFIALSFMLKLFFLIWMIGGWDVFVICLYFQYTHCLFFLVAKFEDGHFFLRHFWGTFALLHYFLKADQKICSELQAEHHMQIS